MQISLIPELYWLTLTTIMTALMWVPYILNRMREQGIWTALYEPHGETATHSTWAERMMRAHTNAVENLVVFAPLVITLMLLGISTPATSMACTIFFFARAAHYLVFTFGVPFLRVITFLVGFACQVSLALVVLKAV